MHLGLRVILTAYLLAYSSFGFADTNTILLDIEETQGAKVSDDLIRKLSRLNYQVKRLSALDATTRLIALKYIDGDTDSITELQQQADFLFFGKASIEAGKALGSPVIPQAATLTLDIIQLKAGTRIYHSMTQATSSFADEKRAAEKALIIAVSRAFRGIKLAFKQSTAAQAPYTYRLRHASSTTLKHILPHLQHLTHITQAGLNPKKHREINLTSTLDLAAFIQQLAHVGPYTLNPTEIRGDTITIGVASAKP